MTNVQPRSDIAYRGTALCDECGSTRQYQRPRNRIYTDTVTWARETGDLKCTTCSKITRHALITGHDHDELYDARCRGRERSYSEAEGRRLAAVYRKHQPSNPRLSHIWRTTDADAAYERGDTHVVTYCGAMEKLPKRGTGVSLPAGSRTPDASHDSIETFVTSWVRADCVDCEYIRNRAIAEQQRGRLKVLMSTALCELLDNSQAGQYDAHVGDLIALLQRVHGEGGQR